MIIPRLLLHLCLLFTFISTSLSNDAISGKISRVIDGDTIQFIASDNELFKVRLNQIDAPEFKSIEASNKNQKFGEESKNSLTDLCEGKNGSMIISGEDRYGRILATLYCEDRNANIYQLESGMAWVYDKYVTDYEYYKYQNSAKSKKLGIWSEEYPLPPWKFRAGQKSYDYRIKEIEQKLENLILLTEDQINIYENKIIELLNQFEETSQNNNENNTIGFSCEKKTCKQMLNCEEAYFQYLQCGNTGLDRDKDGIPCESICN